MQRKVALAVQKEFSDIRLFDQHVGQFYSKRIVPFILALDYFKLKFLKSLLSKFIVSIGFKGMADLSGILRKKVTLLNGQTIKIGIRIEIEIKTGEAKQSPEQRTWQRIIENFGGIHILARSEQQAIAEIKDKLKCY